MQSCTCTREHAKTCCTRKQAVCVSARSAARGVRKVRALLVRRVGTRLLLLSLTYKGRRERGKRRAGIRSKSSPCQPLSLSLFCAHSLPLAIVKICMQCQCFRGNHRRQQRHGCRRWDRPPPEQRCSAAAAAVPAPATHTQSQPYIRLCTPTSSLSLHNKVVKAGMFTRACVCSAYKCVSECERP